MAPPSPSVPYTALQQDRQARNRPTHSETTRDLFAFSELARKASENLRVDESYEARERRYRAASYLESTELLIWWANMRGESLPQTRYHFEKALAGYGVDGSGQIDVWKDKPDIEDYIGAIVDDDGNDAGAGSSRRKSGGSSSRRDRDRREKRRSSDGRKKKVSPAKTGH